MIDFPDSAPGRPLWLVTLADLALLLVGFLVLIQATGHSNGRLLANGFREGFGVHDAPAVVRTPAPPPASPMPVAAAGITDFITGSAALPAPPDALVAWAGDAARDPRVSLTITGSADGSVADVDPETRSATVLAADRARAVAVALAAVAPGRLTITTSAAPGRRAAMVTLAFAGEPNQRRPR